MTHKNRFFLGLLFLAGAVQHLQGQCPTSGNLVVTSTANTGVNTLRWAIDCVNSVAPLNTIVFNIPAAGVNTINLASALPAVTKAGAVIDGTAIESAILNGALITAPANGITISASNVTVKGIRITAFNTGAPGGAGILVSGSNASIEDNYLYNNRIGVAVRDPGVAGPPVPVTDALITGNTIGLNFAGTPAGNSSHGILFENAANSATVSDNTIAHNSGNGVRLAVAGGTALITQNSMYCNAMPGIFRLSSPAAPVITEANTQRIRGTAGFNNVVEVFSYHSTGCPTGAPCQGRTYLGAATANILGNWTLNLAPGAVTAGNLATATRTAGQNNTYGFATCVTIANCSSFSVSITPTLINCNGNSNGQLSATAPGGSSTSYIWSTGATSPTITGLQPGTYSVTATDAAGCTATASATITEPPPLTVNMTGTNISCFGAADGSATANPVGGTPNYQYLWSNGATTQTINNLAPGTYFVTIADANICRIFGNVTINQPPILTISVSSTHETAFNADDGTATATPSGGAGGYQYAWSNGATTQTISNLAPGNYSVTVTDANGCTATGAATVNAFNCGGFSATVSGNNISCNGGANGSATATPSGGNQPFSYAWSNGGSTQTISNLSAGTYSVTVTDADNCPATQSIALTQPPALNVNANATPETAAGADDGTATATPSGGAGGYQYAWSNGATTQTISNLAPGNYSVTVTDANGCTATGAATVNAFNCGGFSATVSGNNISCNGGANGSATATPSGGSQPFSYAWSNGGSTQTISNLSAGTYSVTVTDADNCPATQSITLTQPPGLNVNANATPETAAGADDGTATATPSGGAGGYQYAWSNGATTQTISNLAPGNYSVTVTDANGCTATGAATVNAFNCGGFSATVLGNNISCNGGANGSATATPSGGSQPFSYAWSNGGSTQTISNLSAGTYSVTVTDADNCPATQSIALTQPPALNVNANATPETAAGADDGTATATPSGGAGGYQYAWSNGATTQTISNLAPGNYSVTVTDANGCTATGAATVSAGSPAGACMSQPVYAVSAPSSVCQNELIELEVDDLYPSPDVQYVWFIPTGDSVITTLPRVNITAASPAFAGEYFALRDSLGCRSIHVGGAPVQVVSLPDDAATIAIMDTVMCAPAAVQLRALPALGGPGIWESLGAATVDIPSQTNTTARNLQGGANRFVWKVALDACNLVAGDTVTIFVERPPVARDDNYILQRAQDVLVMEVLLNDDLSGLADTVMSVGDAPPVGQLEFLESARRFRYTVTEEFRGKVSFQYVVCNPMGLCGFPCDTATVTIDVLNLPSVPEGLVVNDPGPNGQLTIRGLNGFTRVEIQVFSRWGDLVFREIDYHNDNPWRGTIHRSGKTLPQGAYYFSLRAFDGAIQVGDTQKGIIHLFEQKN